MPQLMIRLEEDLLHQLEDPAGRRRPGKEYSLVDCMSMVIAREQGSTEVMAHDHHFEPEGFSCLSRPAGR